MKNIDTEKIDQELDKFVNDRDWDQFHSIKNLSMALNVEASELLEMFIWLTQEDSNRVATDTNFKVKVSDEIADIFIYLFKIAKKSEIDIGEAVLSKIKKNSEKYPVYKAKGSAKKYTEL
jgi:dCTP diphosphatase